MMLYDAAIPTVHAPDFVFGLEDGISADILRRFHGIMLETSSPRSVVGDGNCLYRAASLALFGNEDKHAYIRVKTAIELIEHRTFYESTPELLDSFIPQNSYENLVNAAVSINSYSEMTHIYAISAALGYVIQSYMPPISALPFSNPYTRLVCGRGVCNADAPKFTLMWTTSSKLICPTDFQPNHFVYLAKLPLKNKQLTVNDRFNVIDEGSSDVNDRSYNANNVSDDDSSIISDRSLNAYHVSDDISSNESAHSITVDRASDSNDVNEVNDEPEPQSTVVSCGTPLNANGLSTDEVLNLLLNCTPSLAVLPCIPPGIKNNVYFVVEYHGRKKTNMFIDDCGVWNGKSMNHNKYPYLDCNGVMKRIFFVVSTGLYCCEVRSGKKRNYIPIIPQPDDDKVVTLTRYTSKLLANADYKRRVTWLSKTQNSINIAIVEYIGVHVIGFQHGNNRTQLDAVPYVRTPAETMNAINELNKQMPVKKVYNKLISELDIDVAPRNTAVVKNKKYAAARNNRESHGTISYINFADEFQTVFAMLNNDKLLIDSFVRYVIATGHRVPSVILYTERQIKDIKNFCFVGPAGSVVAFDKTYNLGPIYLTLCVYKNLALIRTRSNDNPIFIGPLFLHGHSDAETYGFFFYHLASKFLDCQFSSLTIGSDEEASMRKCILSAFPNAMTVLCERHLRLNADRQLNKCLGLCVPLHKSIRQALFGTDGLATKTDVITYDAAADCLRQNILASAPPKFVDYFERRLVHALRLNVLAGRVGWTNNNAESINHVLKQTLQWRPEQLPNLIEKLRDLVTSQYIEADRALCGRGDFKLAPTHAKYRLTIDVWQQMTAAQRQKASESTFRLVNVSISTSTDGTLTVPTTPGGGKKQHQRKRMRAERCTTAAPSKTFKR